MDTPPDEKSNKTRDHDLEEQINQVRAVSLIDAHLRMGHNKGCQCQVCVRYREEMLSLGQWECLYRVTQ